MAIRIKADIDDQFNYIEEILQDLERVRCSIVCYEKDLDLDIDVSEIDDMIERAEAERDRISEQLDKRAAEDLADLNAWYERQRA